MFCAYGRRYLSFSFFSILHRLIMLLFPDANISTVTFLSFLAIGSCNSPYLYIQRTKSLRLRYGRHLWLAPTVGTNGRPPSLPFVARKLSSVNTKGDSRAVMWVHLLYCNVVGKGHYRVCEMNEFRWRGSSIKIEKIGSVIKVDAFPVACAVFVRSHVQDVPNREPVHVSLQKRDDQKVPKVVLCSNSILNLVFLFISKEVVIVVQIIQSKLFPACLYHKLNKHQLAQKNSTLQSINPYIYITLSMIHCTLIYRCVCCRNTHIDIVVFNLPKL